MPGAGVVDFNPNPELKRLRGSCGEPFPRELAEHGAAELREERVRIEDGQEVTVSQVVVSGRQVLAGWQGALRDAEYTYCPMVHLDPMSPAYEPLAWLEEAIAGAQALGADMRLADAMPDVSVVGRELVMGIMHDQRVRMSKEAPRRKTAPASAGRGKWAGGL